jgi:hypothetical protein
VVFQDYSTATILSPGSGIQKAQNTLVEYADKISNYNSILFDIDTMLKYPLWI